MERAIGKSPAFMFYPNDYLRDTQAATPSVRGIWMDLLCAMWWSKTRGVLTGTEEEMCRYGRCSVAAWREFVELNSRQNFANVTFCDGIVTVTNRRMAREERARELTRSRVKRHRDASCNANVTAPSPSTPSTPSTPVPFPTTKERPKTLATVVDKSTPWPAPLDDVRSFLLSIQAPDQFFNQTYWLRIDQWLGSTDSAVYYFDELKAYLAWIASQNGHRKHRDLLRGFRNWLSTCSRWKERDAQRKAIERRH